MKKILMAIVALMTLTTSANAMSYEQARREALFLTDKMAYELNLTDDQYDAAYEINLDYLMGVTSVDDVYGTYWTRRNMDFNYILHEWQWDLFRAATYFYRPLYWNAGCWHFGIYARYPHRHYFYFSHPTVYVSYRGGHSWRSNGGHSYYHGHKDHYRRTVSTGGMRDRWDRGEISHNNRNVNNRPNDNRFERNNNGSSNRRNNSSYNNSSYRFDRSNSSSNSSNRIDRSNSSSRNSSYRFDRSDGSSRNSSTRVTVRQRNENRIGQPQNSSVERPKQIERRSNMQVERRSNMQVERRSNNMQNGSRSMQNGSRSNGGQRFGSSSSSRQIQTKRM
ncbi:MAG: hypothetical protein ACI3Y0_05540 [Prevotella sp.]